MLPSKHISVAALAAVTLTFLLTGPVRATALVTSVSNVAVPRSATTAGTFMDASASEAGLDGPMHLTSTPEPGMLLFMAGGVILLSVRRRRNRRK